MAMRVDEGREEEREEMGKGISMTSRGIVTVAVVPTPSFEVKPIVPFMRRTICAERLNPRPAPAEKAFFCLKAVKRSSLRNVSSIPHPVPSGDGSAQCTGEGERRQMFTSVDDLKPERPLCRRRRREDF